MGCTSSKAVNRQLCPMGRKMCEFPQLSSDQEQVTAAWWVARSAALSLVRLRSLSRGCVRGYKKNRRPRISTQRRTRMCVGVAYQGIDLFSEGLLRRNGMCKDNCR